MKAEYMSDDGNAVDYELLKQSQLYKDYKLSTMKLHSVNLAKLSENEKQAFFISILLESNMFFLFCNIFFCFQNKLCSQSDV